MKANRRGRRWTAPELVAELGAWCRPDRPLHLQLSERLTALVDEGTIADHDLLPSERSLATGLAVSRRTIEACYDGLRASGRVASRPGVGTWCTSPRPWCRGDEEPAGCFRQLLSSSPSSLDLKVASLPAHPLVIEAADATSHLVRTVEEGHGYLPEGLDCLREGVARWFESHGVPTEPDQISITAGAAQALLIAAGLLPPGSAVWVESPTSPTILSALRWHGLRLRPAHADGNGMRVPADLDGQALFVTPAYLNPTGARLSEDRGMKLAHAATHTSSVVVEDLTLIDLRLDGPRPHPVAAYAPQGNVVSIGSMSKLFWAGLRLGWIRAPRHLSASLVHRKGALDLGTAVEAQARATWLLEQREVIAKDRAAGVRRRRDALVEALRRHLPQWSFAVPEGGLSLWVRLPGPHVDDVVTRAQLAGVSLLPGRTFAVDGHDSHHLRLPYVQEPDVLVEVVRRLERAYRSRESRRPSPRR